MPCQHSLPASLSVFLAEGRPDHLQAIEEVVGEYEPTSPDTKDTQDVAPQSFLKGIET